MPDAAAIDRVISRGSQLFSRAGRAAQQASNEAGHHGDTFDVWTHTGGSPAGNPAETGVPADTGTPQSKSALPVSALPGAMVQQVRAMRQAAADIGKAKGALATAGAVMNTLTSLEKAISLPLSTIPFPAFPAVRVTDMDVGLPHAHNHPPNLIPPAPPVPLPSTGPVISIPYVSGASTVRINGMPAGRCGDMGLGIWCGGYFPMFEIFLGSSSVWIEGMRAARMGVDITKHCTFSHPKPSDPPLGPMVGMTISGSPNVLIGGVPMPSLTNLAIGAAMKVVFKGLGKITTAVREAGALSQAENRTLETGARRVINPESVTSWDKAEAAYELIRQDAADVSQIAENTGMSVADVTNIKNHLFFNEHQLDEGVRRFDADPEIANAWSRLKQGDFVPSDIDLLEHELYELNHERANGTDYRTAHNAALAAGKTWNPE